MWGHAGRAGGRRPLWKELQNREVPSDQAGCCGSNVMTYVFVMSNEGNCAEALMMRVELRYFNPSNRDG